MSVSKVFINIFEMNKWASKESVSGTGSEVGVTGLLRESLPTLLKEYGIKSMLDLPCGDFNWMKEVDLTGIDYIGADIVPKLIENTKTNHPDVKFEVMDLITSDLPKVDLIMVRDCLVHLTNENVMKALNNVKKSGSKYLLTTSFIDKDNPKDIQNGQWRAINLIKTPFSVPEPLTILPDGGVEYYGEKHKNKSMILIDIDKMEYYG